MTSVIYCVNCSGVGIFNKRVCMVTCQHFGNSQSAGRKPALAEPLPDIHAIMSSWEAVCFCTVFYNTDAQSQYWSFTQLPVSRWCLFLQLHRKGQCRTPYCGNGNSETTALSIDSRELKQRIREWNWNITSISTDRTNICTTDFSVHICRNILSTLKDCMVTI